jgi:hypothetical protein
MAKEPRHAESDAEAQADMQAKAEAAPAPPPPPRVVPGHDPGPAAYDSVLPGATTSAEALAPGDEVPGSSFGLPSAEADNVVEPVITQFGIKPVGSATIGSLAAVPIIPMGVAQSIHNFLPLAQGTVTVNGATGVVVSNPAVTPNSSISFTLKTVGGTVGAQPTITSITPGTGFTVAATAADTSTYNYLIVG